MSERKILALPRERFFKQIGNDRSYFNGYSHCHYDVGRLNVSDGDFVLKKPAEIDKSLKQPIPYVVVIDSNNRILQYRRASGGNENRLHNKLSIGIGGHIELCDLEEVRNNTKLNSSRILLIELVLVAARRELQEEIGIVPNTIKQYGYVNDDLTPVGAVHFGLVYMFFVSDEEKKLIKTNHEMEDVEFVDVDKICDGDLSKYEDWSRLMLPSFYNTQGPR